MGTRKQLNFSVEENKRLFEIWGKPSIVRGAMPQNKDAAIPYLAKISNAMAIKGCPRSVEDIQKRINYLVTSHKRLRNKQDSGKAFNISWEFYDPVQEIMDYAASLDEQEELKKDEVEKNPAEKGEDEDEDDDDTSESSSNSSISQKSYQPLTSGEAIESNSPAKPEMAPVLIKPKVTPEIVEPAAKRPRRASLLAVADVSAGKIQTAPRKDDKPEISHDRQAMEPITLNNNLRNIVADCGDETKRNVDTDAEKQQKISAIADELQSFIELKENQMKLAELKKKDETKVAGMMGNKTENAEWKEPGIRDLLKDMLDVSSQRLEIEKNRISREQGVFTQMVQILRTIVPMIPKPKAEPMDTE